MMKLESMKKADDYSSHMLFVLIGAILGSLAGMLALGFLDMELHPNMPHAGMFALFGPFVGGPIGSYLGFLLALVANRRQ